MIFPHTARSRSFLAVGMGLILGGAMVLAVGIVQWLLMTFGDYMYGWPAAKVAAGAVIVALGYIVLELELIRTKA